MHSFQTAGNASTERGEITLIGIEPTFPATGFWYIQRGNAVAEGSEVCHVESFKEKPDYETASEYIDRKSVV